MTDQLLLNTLIEIRRELHRFPELSMKEYETTKRIKKWLKHYDISMFDFVTFNLLYFDSDCLYCLFPMTKGQER